MRAFPNQSPRLVLALAAVCAYAHLASATLPAAQWTRHPAHGTPVLRASLRRHGHSRPLSILDPADHKKPVAFAHIRQADLVNHPELVPHVLRTSTNNNTDVVVVPLGGGIAATLGYYATLQLGGQTFNVQVDTGSSNLAVPSKQCKSCREKRKYNLLHKSNSTNGQRLPCSSDICQNTGSPSIAPICTAGNKKTCGFQLSYADNSTVKGELIQDKLTWGGRSVPIVFGATLAETKDFEIGGVDGIIGLSFPEIACNPSCVQPPADTMAAHLGMKKIFQTCMANQSGSLILGGYDPALGSSAPVWVPMALKSPPDVYRVKAQREAIVDSSSLSLPGLDNIVVDSGTTFIELDSESYKVLIKFLKSKYCHVLGICDSNSWLDTSSCAVLGTRDLRDLPTITFPIHGFDIVLTPDDYLVKSMVGDGKICWGFGIQDGGAGTDNIFGNTFMQRYTIIYDRENMRIGFAESKGLC